MQLRARKTGGKRIKETAHGKRLTREYEKSRGKSVKYTESLFPPSFPLPFLSEMLKMRPT